MNKFKNFGGLLMAFLFLFVAAPAFALAAPAAPDLLDPGNLALYGGAVVGILEIILRVLPTNKDYSVLTRIVKILNAILPANKAKTPKGTGIFQSINFKKAVK